MKKKKPFHKAEINGQDQSSNAGAEDEYATTLARMDALLPVPERDPARTWTGRQAFLAQARNLQPIVSTQAKPRLIGWTSIFRKERSPMFILARIVLLAAIALGGTGVTAYAAQESLPDQALYPVKTWIEDVRLALANGPQADFGLLQGFVEERIEEIEALVGEGLPVPNQVSDRLETQLQQMMRLAAQMEEPAMLQAMEQVQERLQLQVQRLEKIQNNAPEDAQALGLATQAMNNIRNTAEEAILDPTTFRMRLGNERPQDAPVQPEGQQPDKQEQGGGQNGTGGSNQGNGRQP